MATPVQGSWGGVINFKHNFPYLAGDTAVIQYEAPDGTLGELASTVFDATEISARVSDNLFDQSGLDWKFNMKITGTRPSGLFSIQSKQIRKRFYPGIGVFL